MATMNIIQAMNRLRSDIQTWVANNLKVKVNTELKTDSTEEYKVLSDNNFTDADKNKLDGIAEGAEVNVQSDWNVTDSDSDAFIKNKPTIPNLNGYATEAWVNSQGFKTTDNDTHYVTGITVGESGTIANAAITDPYIKIKDDNTHRSQIQVKGSGTVTVTSDSNGVITINSTGVEAGDIDLSGYKIKQSAIPDPSVTNETSTTFISSISQDDNGVITATKKKLPAGVTESTVSGWGFTKNTGTVTSVKINGSTKTPTNGVVDLGSDYATQTWVTNRGYKTTDNNYYPTTFSWTNGTTSGPTGLLTGSGMPDVSFPAIPAANSDKSGIITTGAQQFAGNKTFTGTVTGTQGFFDTSDERLKNFVKDLSIDFEIIAKIPKKYFTWKSDNQNLQIGTSAQEVQKIYPELVNESEDGTLSVAYDKLSIVALAAIDELYKKNQELEERINKLEQMLIGK